MSVCIMHSGRACGKGRSGSSALTHAHENIDWYDGCVPQPNVRVEALQCYG